MLESLDYIDEDGSNVPCEITVFALSTCGFCKRSLMFLRDNHIRFKYIYVDLLDMELKEKVKSALSDKFTTRIGFPFAVLNGNEYLRGFNQEEWAKKLL
ncbi:MAG TPA: glutaredoxin family protein [Spirochaetota bacterium]|nr:glutaredoxin family protein [Spirochaetota bacterium]